MREHTTAMLRNPVTTAMSSSTRELLGRHIFPQRDFLRSDVVTCQYESGLSCLHVAQRGPEVRLVSDGTLEAVERITPGEADNGAVGLILRYIEWLWARMDQDLRRKASVLFVGGVDYTLPTKLLASRPKAHEVAVEIDPLMTTVVRLHMPSAAEVIART